MDVSNNPRITNANVQNVRFLIDLALTSLLILFHEPHLKSWRWIYIRASEDIGWVLGRVQEAKDLLSQSQCTHFFGWGCGSFTKGHEQGEQGRRLRSTLVPFSIAFFQSNAEGNAEIEGFFPSHRIQRTRTTGRVSGAVRPFAHERKGVDAVTLRHLETRPQIWSSLLAFSIKVAGGTTVKSVLSTPTNYKQLRASISANQHASSSKLTSKSSS